MFREGDDDIKPEMASESESVSRSVPVWASAHFDATPIADRRWTDGLRLRDRAWKGVCSIEKKGGRREMMPAWYKAKIRFVQQIL